MKRNILILIICLITIFSCKKEDNNSDLQPLKSIPNSNFENWLLKDGFDKPESWNTSNFSLYGILTINAVSKDSAISEQKNYFPKLETKSQLIDNEFVKVAGLLTLGSFDINISTRKAEVNGGIPFSQRPRSLSGKYKYMGIGIDSCIIGISLTNFKPESNICDTIGFGKFASGNINDWTNFDIPINYRSNDLPDSLNIIILSSDTSIFETGSTLWVDDLLLNYE